MSTKMQATASTLEQGTYITLRSSYSEAMTPNITVGLGMRNPLSRTTGEAKATMRSTTANTALFVSLCTYKHNTQNKCCFFTLH